MVSAEVDSIRDPVGGDAFDEAVRVLAQAGLVLGKAVLVQD
ncbi:Alcohol dehydrogenase [Rhodococcus wratislaviensis]|uniref:Alcohol dehydrogenase n=1 Tax=Rhodococcus wratislaviensis TaxID=44752 RepID=A0A402BXW9_RHOWR|nr:Alcohol dehydrogenase [Rhodococcus wratislaviensis]